MSKVNKILVGVFAVLIVLAIIVVMNMNDTETSDQSGSKGSQGTNTESVSDEKVMSDEDISKSDEIIAQAFDEQKSDIRVEGQGTVKALLKEDTKGNEHQKFILELDSGQTLMFAHNISISKKIEDLKGGDTIQFAGEYVYNDEGGLVHWTHKDPGGSHEAGWLIHNGTTYN